VSKQERVFNKLDPKNPQHARKIQQRRKAIGNGKNTVGYDIYCRSISKEKRQKRSMITPSTPDHTLDIPNKKWNGMIRSWRISLHRYDPVDLQHSFVAAQEAAEAERQKESKSPIDATLSVKEKELADSGLLNLVEVTNNEYSVPQFPSRPTTNNVVLQQSIPNAAAATAITPNGIIDDQGSKQIISGLDQWEDTSRGDHEDASFFSGEDDSDDDLL